jgi:hypothetical protein
MSAMWRMTDRWLSGNNIVALPAHVVPVPVAAWAAATDSVMVMMMMRRAAGHREKYSRERGER